jgi:hypothetical protein
MSEEKKDRFGQKLVPCELCGEDTPMTGTKRCDRCWELEKRIRDDPRLAINILANLPVAAAQANALLVDIYNPEEGPKLPVTIEFNKLAILIRPQGYGDCCSDDGAGTPILIENRKGVPHLCVWADINREDAGYTISLEQAAEKLRKER